MNNTDPTVNDAPVKPTKNRRSLWGWGVAALYGGFALFMLGLAGFASLLDFQLVEEDYYDKGLAFQEKINKRERASALVQNVSWTFDKTLNKLVISFPEEFIGSEISGTVALFRPSNARLDREIAIEVDAANHQTVDCAQLVGGLWKIKIDWAVSDRSFYYENILVIE